MVGLFVKVNYNQETDCHESTFEFILKNGHKYFVTIGSYEMPIEADIKEMGKASVEFLKTKLKYEGVEYA